jgi:hypothetical protein
VERGDRHEKGRSKHEGWREQGPTMPSGVLALSEPPCGTEHALSDIRVQLAGSPYGLMHGD